mgnify:FL=1
MRQVLTLVLTLSFLLPAFAGTAGAHASMHPPGADQVSSHHGHVDATMDAAMGAHEHNECAGDQCDDMNAMQCCDMRPGHCTSLMFFGEAISSLVSPHTNANLHGLLSTLWVGLTPDIATPPPRS